MSDVDKMYGRIVASGVYEGIILKTNSPYVHKRTYDWIKKKPTKTWECRIVNATYGKGKYQGQISSLTLAVLTPGGSEVVVGNVGSGFSKDTIAEMTKLYTTDDLVGQIVEIKCDRFTDVDGTPKMRFPRFIRFRPDRDEPSVVEEVMK